MLGVLDQIILWTCICALIFGLGALAKVFQEIKIGVAFILGFIFLGLLISRQGVNLGPNTSLFLTLFMTLFPAGYMAADPFMTYLSAQSEKLFARDDFDPTYKTYAKRHRTNHFTDFQWFNSDGYHHWNQERYKEANEENGGYSHAEHSAEHSSQTTTKTGPTKADMLAILGLPEQTTGAKRIKSAYRKLARKYHPDILASKNISEAEKDRTAQKMQEINGAYDWLQDHGFA